MSKINSKAHRPERIILQADETGLHATLSSLTQEQEYGWFDILDAIIRADSRGYETICIDPATGKEVHLYNFPIQILKYLDAGIHNLQGRSRGNGTITLTIKNGAFFTGQVQPVGQEAEKTDFTNLPEEGYSVIE